ncbi:MAG: ankyrin repeat domain-containing protein [Desulfomonilaceae bacterium]
MGSLRSLMRRQVKPVILPKPSDEELIQTIQFGTVEQVEILLKQGANPNAVDDDLDSALTIAAFIHDIKLVKLLTSHGADVNYRNHNGLTPLHDAAFASLKAAQEIGRILLDQGADVNAFDSLGRTPLMCAVDKRNVDLVKILLERGADATRRNSNGERALDLIGRNKHAAALKAILEPVS